MSEALERLGGVATRKQLLLLVTRPQLTAALAGGEVVNLRRGTYAVAGVDAARAAAVTTGGVVSHLSAALAHGWRVKSPPPRPVVTVASNSHPVVGQGIDLRWGDVAGQCGVTDPVRTVVDCARTLPYDEALAVADSALRAGAVSRAQLLEAAAGSPRTGRAKAIRVARAASDLAANPFESVLRAIAHDVPGLEVVPQGEVGTSTHPDLVDFRLGIVIEAESFAHHALPEAFEYDVRRYTALVRAGWTVLRFTWADVMRRPDYVRAVLVDVRRQREFLLAAGVLRPPARA